MKSAVLVLENGRVFRGQAVGPVSEAIGEVVFNTSMTGYQEILSDPSYAGQIVVMTAPQIGNTGVNLLDMEAEAVHCVGMVMREYSPVHSNWRSEGSLSDFFAERQVGGIEGIDTRALTRVLREEGAMRGAISTQVDDIEALLLRIKDAPSMEGQNLAEKVSCKEAYSWQEGTWLHPEEEDQRSAKTDSPWKVVALDFGIKKNILRNLAESGCQVQVLPYASSLQEILAHKPDGVFLSNGPGDPAACTQAIETVKELLKEDLPVFGICLGHQILGLALGAKSSKLRFGHHGGNHPVMELSTRKVEITAQNHGFVVDADSLPEGVQCTHENLYDNTLAGLAVDGRPVFGVQYHPEASPGPHDSSYLFERFVGAMQDRSAR